MNTKQNETVPRHIGLVAHDNCKKDLVAWVRKHVGQVRTHRLICTGTTGRLVREALQADLGGATMETAIEILKSGPLGGDQQMGARIAEGSIDMLIFFWDPMLSQPHDVDVKALLRIANLYNIPSACNMATADYLIASPLFDKARPETTYNFSNYTERSLA